MKGGQQAGASWASRRAATLLLVILWAAVGLAGLWGCGGSGGAPEPTRQDVTAEQLQAMIEDGQPIVLLDVRGVVEYGSGHIASSLNVPLADLEARLDELDPDAPTVCICGSGVRSPQAAQILLANGFTRVYNLEGGLATWDGPLVPTS